MEGTKKIYVDLRDPRSEITQCYLNGGKECGAKAIALLKFILNACRIDLESREKIRLRLSPTDLNDR